MWSKKMLFETLPMPAAARARATGFWVKLNPAAAESCKPNPMQTNV
jgi:hypothetical protein